LKIWGRYGGTYWSTFQALAPKLGQGAKFILGGHAWAALSGAAARCVIALEELRSPQNSAGGGAGGRLSTVLAVVAALAVREILGVVWRVVMAPMTKSPDGYALY
jgi:hypothetical protein